MYEWPGKVPVTRMTHLKCRIFLADLQPIGIQWHELIQARVDELKLVTRKRGPTAIAENRDRLEFPGLHWLQCRVFRQLCVSISNAQQTVASPIDYPHNRHLGIVHDVLRNDLRPRFNVRFPYFPNTRNSRFVLFIAGSFIPDLLHYR